jgi:Ca2+-binding EF-hand superfamily protein
MSQFTEQQIIELKEAFSLFDTDEDELLDAKDLILLYRKLGIAISDSDVKEIISSIDKEGTGKISFKDFVDISASAGSFKDEEIQEVFKVFDKDNKGTITKTDLKQVFRDIGEKVTDQGLEELFTLVDIKGDVITFPDLKKMMTK